MSESNPGASFGASGQQSDRPIGLHGMQPPGPPPYAQGGSARPSSQPASQTYQPYAAPSSAPRYEDWPVGQPGVAPAEQWPAGQPSGSPYQQPSAGQQGGAPLPAQPGQSSTGQGQAPATGKRSVLAIVSFVLGLIVVAISLFSGIVVAAIGPILLGVVALQDIKRKGKKGRGLAIAGIVLGGISTVLYLINIAVG